MATPFVGEIRIFAGNFAPVNWAFCDGSTLSISQNATLFNLIGTTYGGNGQTTYNLPDLRGRVAIHQGTGAGLSPYVLGQAGGVESVPLTNQQLPGHTHVVQCNETAGDTRSPVGGFPAMDATAATTLYA